MCYHDFDGIAWCFISLHWSGLIIKKLPVKHFRQSYDNKSRRGVITKTF